MNCVRRCVLMLHHLLLIVLLGGCLSQPLINDSNSAAAIVMRRGLLPENLVESEPVFTCYGSKEVKPEGCQKAEVSPLGEYFSETKMRERYRHEWRNPAPAGRPIVGLALSGGGTKGGDYALGVLSGLLSTDTARGKGSVREQSRSIDVISSVSGGSYAALWYFSRLLDFFAELRDVDYQNIDSRKVNDFNEIFRDCLPKMYEEFSDPEFIAERQQCPETTSNYDAKANTDSYRFQNQLRGFQDVFLKDFEYEATTKTPSAAARISKEFLISLPMLPAHWLVHGLLDLKFLNVSTSARRYYLGIDRTYASAPVDCVKQQQYDKNACLNGRPTPNLQAGRGQTMAALSTIYFFQDAITRREKAKSGDFNLDGVPRVPFWIVNTTAGVSPEPLNVLAPMPDFEDSIFELTPVSFGSRHYGWWEGTPPRFELARVTGASGSFLDGQQRDLSGLRRPVIASLLWVFNFEWGVNLPNPRFQDSVRTKHYFLPFPLSWAHHRVRNNNAAWIHLSDGGMSDNLGVFSLIRRGVPVIVAADSAFDEKGRFDDLCRLKTQLSNRELYLHMPQLQGFEDFCGLEKTSRYDLWNWPVALPWLEGCVSSERENDACLAGPNMISRIVLLKPAINWPEIFVHIKSCGIKSQCPQALRNLRAQMPGFPTELFGFLMKNRSESKPGGGPIFPQHSTAFMTVNSSPWLYGAYRELAQWQTQGLPDRLDCLKAEARARLNIRSTARQCASAPNLLTVVPLLTE
jgi:hypothetical protein